MCIHSNTTSWQDKRIEAMNSIFVKIICFEFNKQSVFKFEAKNKKQLIRE